MKLGYSTWGMPRVPAETVIDHLSTAGFDGMELTVLPDYSTSIESLGATERQQIKRLSAERDLEIPAIAAHSNVLELDPGRWAVHRRRLHDAVDLPVDLATNHAPHLSEPPAEPARTTGTTKRVCSPIVLASWSPMRSRKG